MDGHNAAASHLDVPHVVVVVVATAQLLGPVALLVLKARFGGCQFFQQQQLGQANHILQRVSSSSTTKMNTGRCISAHTN